MKTLYLLFALCLSAVSQTPRAVWVETEVTSQEIAKDPKKWENKAIKVSAPTAWQGRPSPLKPFGDRYILSIGKAPNELTIVYTEEARKYYFWCSDNRVSPVYAGEVKLDPNAGILRLYLTRGLKTTNSKPVRSAYP